MTQPPIVPAPQGQWQPQPGYGPPPGWQPAPKKKMGVGKKILIGIVSFFVLFIAAAIISGPADSAKSTASATTTSAALNKDDVFALFLITHGFTIGSPDQKAALVNLAHKVCDGWAAGMTEDQVGSVLLSSNTSDLTPTQLGTLVGAGTTHYCPEYNDKIGN